MLSLALNDAFLKTFDDYVPPIEFKDECIYHICSAKVNISPHSLVCCCVKS